MPKEVPLFHSLPEDTVNAPDTGAIRRVILVDDSRLQRKILSASLARDGYTVLEASSGEEALELCAEQPVDLVLSDWMMPGMDGLELCQAFRELQQDHYGYFILLTSKSEKDEVAKGLQSGADDFLVKPVNAHELRARIAAGERILRMQRELTKKNEMISETLNELQRLYDSLDHDLVEAKKLQQSLVRNRYQNFGAGRVSLMLRSSGHVGGDLVGHYVIDENRVGLFSIDVSGHGISSALMTARLAGYLSSAAPEQNIGLQMLDDGSYGPVPPAEVIARLNTLILDEMETEHYFTMLLAEADLRTGLVKMAQAGHPHPVVHRANGDIEQEGPGGLPVGLIAGASFTEFEVTLAPGDRLMVFSDGVTECPAPNGDMLGEEGLARMVALMAEQQGEELLETLLWQLGDYAGGRGFPDDISGILFEYTG